MTIPREEIHRFIQALIPQIGDEYRATDEDTEPSMQLTIACNDSMTEWNYQTGDNSYFGGAYGLPHWAIVYLYRDSKPEDIVSHIFSEWQNLLDDCVEI